jgi:molecular chaperone HtpG
MQTPEEPEGCRVSLATTAPEAADAPRGDQADSLDLDDIVIGKDVLELVSSAMYVDPMTVYREYIQNAADAVDEARAQGVLGPNEQGQVEIAVDAASRTVLIRDNGAGIPSVDFGARLTAIGGSAKRGTKARGFRGVGRLAGLGYAQELVFRSRVAGENRVSQLRWDCRRLKAALRGADHDTGVAELIRRVVSLERVPADGYPPRFFEVELRGIIRLRNDRLMGPASIADYLSQVAPVPFDPDFPFAPEITEALAPHIDMSALDVRIGGAATPLYRPHGNRLQGDDGAAIAFDSLDVVQIPGIDGDTAAIAWVLHHAYEGALPTGTHVKGLRLRAGNIQVGDHALLEDLFPETRFNSWAVGEVHVLDRRIVPNGRRDHFEQNAHFHNLTNHLAPTAQDIARRCRISSVRRRWLREFELQAQAVDETLGIIRQGSVSQTERARLALSAEQALMQLGKIADMVVVAGDAAAHKQRIDALRAALAAVMGDLAVASSPLMRLPEEQRQQYEHFFELIYQCSTNRVAAKALIDRILLRFE